ncbi:MAG TPA: hypothetical protein VGP06_06935, partial [Janthinobacterium sp.]|nr:hypothetical protein [Janthinobacterium sp.]
VAEHHADLRRLGVELLGHRARRHTRKKNPTLRLPFFERPNKKDLAEAKSLIFLVARGGIEPPTQGFSILYSGAHSD